MSLIPGTSALAEGLSGKWRNRLRHAGQQPLHVTHRPFAPDLEHWLLRKEGEQARARGYRPLPARMVCALAAADPGAAQLLTAHLYGQRVAAKLFLRHGNRATYQIGRSTPEGRARSAGTLLMWRAMLALRGMGVTQIDLGAADPATAPGLARFKQGTGATLRDLGALGWTRAPCPDAPCNRRQPEARRVACRFACLRPLPPRATAVRAQVGPLAPRAR